MRNQGHDARRIFTDDVEDTYKRIRDRCKVLAEERAERGVETIQLQATDPNTKIHIAVPDDDSPEEVKKIFDQFPQEFQDALKAGTLEAVNKVLEKMRADLAEQVVKVCNACGFLSVEGEIIDQTKEIPDQIPTRESAPEEQTEEQTEEQHQPSA